jgi:asparagine synthase (glutamine-hydrolysing)
VMGASLWDTRAGIAVALDGTLANAGELRELLRRRNFRIEQGTGAELLVRAYQYWDKDVVRHLRGPFAFALWDSRKDRLMLARDRFGERPLYLQERDAGLFFASEAKALLKAPGARFEPDLDGMRECLALRYVPGPRTLFRGIRKLAPGTYAMWQFGRLQPTRYWTPPDRQPPGAAAPAAPRKEAEAAFTATLAESAALCEGDGVLLSGGIDSAMIVAVLSARGDGVRTFSLGFQGDRKSELAGARAVAKHFGTRHEEIVLESGELLADLNRLVAAQDAPLATPSALAVHCLAAEAGRTARRLVSGDGCEEILGGYRRHVAERFHPGFCEAMETRQGKWVSAILPPAQKGKSSSDPHYPEADPQASSLRRALYRDQVRWLPDQLLERNDRAAAIAGVELRMPFVDHALAQLVSSLPDDQRVRGLATKWILRQAARRLLPDSLARRKAGFRLPVRDWLRNELRDTLREHLQGAESETRRYYDSAALDRLLDEHLKGKNNHAQPLWTLLNLEIWHRQHSRA